MVFRDLTAFLSSQDGRYEEVGIEMEAPEVLGTSARTRFTLPAKKPDLAALRVWVGALIGDLPEDVRLDVLLVCTELASNAYEHATGPRVVRVQRHVDFIRIEADDRTPAELPHLGESRLGDSRGRGLLLIAQLSRCWGTREFAGGKTVWAEVSA